MYHRMRKEKIKHSKYAEPPVRKEDFSITFE
jgi:hypothetical protein